jgi:putative transposase
VFGISRQAIHKRKKSLICQEQQTQQIIELIMTERMLMPRLGGRKVYRRICSQLENKSIKIGRDKLFSVMRENKLLVKRKKNFTKTTDSNHRFRKHPNRIKGIKITRPEQIWAADITYINSKQGHLYLALITDCYSKQIMGAHLSDNLKTDGPLQALKIALSKRKFPELKLIHHSDRGFQYCSNDYTNLLEVNNIEISMTQSYDPYENAVAERVNGILKNEFDLDGGFEDFIHAQKEIKHSINIYNNLRPHLSCNYLTPMQAHSFGTYALKSWSKVFTTKRFSTKEKSGKKENSITTITNFKN